MMQTLNDIYLSILEMQARSPALRIDLESLHEVGRIAMHTASAKGRTFNNVGEQIALMHSELSEALEAARQPTPLPDKYCPEFTNFEIELADTIIRILGYCYYKNIKIGDAILAKLAYNVTRKDKKEF